MEDAAALTRKEARIFLVSWAVGTGILLIWLPPYAAILFALLPTILFTTKH